MKASHPDAGRSNANNDTVERFEAVQEAYEVLSDVDRRSAYDAILTADGTQATFVGGLDGCDAKTWVLRAAVASVTLRFEGRLEDEFVDQGIAITVGAAIDRFGPGPARQSSVAAAKLVAYRATTQALQRQADELWPADDAPIGVFLAECLWVTSQYLWNQLDSGSRPGWCQPPPPAPPIINVERTASPAQFGAQAPAATPASAAKTPAAASPKKSSDNSVWLIVGAIIFAIWVYTNWQRSNTSPTTPIFTPTSTLYGGSPSGAGRMSVPTTFATWSIGACVDSAGSIAMPVPCSSPLANAHVVDFATTPMGCPATARSYVTVAAGVWCIGP